MPDQDETSTKARTDRHISGPIGTSRYVISMAIFGTALSAFSIMLYGVLVVFRTVVQTFRHRPYDLEQSKHFTVEIIEITDLFLFGMVLYVVAIGMYQLFINPDVNLPEWMRVESLGDLKTQLVNVIVVLLAVTFLATTVSWTGGQDILSYGAAIALVIVALAIFNIVHHRMEHD